MDSYQVLQKTYGDMFLNVSKEAAAKVLVAERKAQQMEHELQVTKNESVQMMTRLKKMMDDKISEANMTSRNKQEKIDQLEAQLGEAEDIVIKLREELRYVQADCERLCRNNVKHHAVESEKDSLVAGSDKENLYQNHYWNGYANCSREAIQLRNLYGPMPELPSILLRSKERSLYRNRCTEKIIHAIKRNTSGSEVEKMFNKANTETVCKEACISCRYEVIQTIDSILKAAKTVTSTKYRKKKTVSSKKIPDRLFRKLHETPGMPQSHPATKSLDMTCTATQLLDNECDIEKLISKGEPLVDSLVPVVLKDDTSTECSDFQVCKTNLNKVNQSTPLPDLMNTINNGTSKGSSLQLFKYTYQRKRKRET